MRGLFILFLCFFVYCTPAEAIGRKHRYNGLPRTEVELMTKVLECLKYKDTISYYNLFPPFDTLWNMVLHNADQTPEAQKELAKLREHPTVLIDLDPYYNHSIIGRYAYVLGKGEDSGLNWKGIVMQRFELQKTSITRGLEGLEHIAPERFKGFLFVRDMLSSTTYCITITEIQKVKGFYYGGQVLNVLEANDIDQYLAREKKEDKYLAKLRQLDAEHKTDSVKVKKDSATTQVGSLAGVDVTSDSFIIAKYLEDSAREAKSANKNLTSTGDVIPKMPVDTAKIRKDKLLLSTSVMEDEAGKTRREVVDRKFYKGKFDDEIPVELYVRYMKDVKGKVSGWDGLYKFGDMEQYVKLDITKVDGKWLFEEPSGTMDLELNNKIYTGSWTGGESQTGYDAELTQKDLSQQKMEMLDRILENGTWGVTDKQKIREEGNNPENAKKDPLKHPEKNKDTDDGKTDKKKQKKVEEEPKKPEADPKETKKDDTEKKESPEKKEKAPKKETKKGDDAPKTNKKETPADDDEESEKKESPVKKETKKEGDAGKDKKKETPKDEDEE